MADLDHIYDVDNDVNYTLKDTGARSDIVAINSKLLNEVYPVCFCSVGGWVVQDREYNLILTEWSNARFNPEYDNDVMNVRVRFYDFQTPSPLADDILIDIDTVIEAQHRHLPVYLDKEKTIRATIGHIRGRTVDFIYVPLERTYYLVNERVLSEDVIFDTTNTRLSSTNVQDAIAELDDDLALLTASQVGYDHTSSGLVAITVQDAIDEIASGSGGGTAASISYDNTGSGLQATDVQDAIDEVVDDLADKVDSASLATVATSGSYNDLSDKPTIVGQVNSDWNATSGVEEILNKPSLAPIATSGQADDVDYDNTSSGLTASNAQDAIDELSQEKADTISLAAVATSGNYNDLSNRPTIPDISTKMDKNDPTGTGSFSLNRAAGSTVGGYSHAEGSDCTASGSFAHAEGTETTSSGRASHSEGYRTTASDGSAHAEGQDTTASGVSSHAEGFDTEASGDSSHAEGSGTRAASDNQHVSGKYNIVDNNDTFAEIIGNGSGDSSRSNARTLDWQGNETITGDLFFGGGSSGLTAQLGAKQATLVSGSNIKTVNGSSILGSGNLTTPCPDNYTVIKDSGSAATQAASGSWHEDASWTFPATGIWLVQASLTWDSNATGYRMSGINTSVAQPAATNIMRTSATNGNQTTHNITIPLRVTSTTQRYYLTSLHNAGAALTTYPRVNAIRLTP